MKQKQGHSRKHKYWCWGVYMYVEREVLKDLWNYINYVSRVQYSNLGLIILIVIGEIVKKNFPVGYFNQYKLSPVCLSALTKPWPN